MALSRGTAVLAVLVVAMMIVGDALAVSNKIPLHEPGMSHKQAPKQFEGVQNVAQFVYSAMNWTVSPCADFYNFSCGSWLSSTSIPSDKSSYTRSFGMIEENNDAVLYDIVQNPTTGKVNTYWSACMNTTQIDAYGTTGLNAILSVVAGVKDLNTLMFAVGTLQRYGVNTFFGWGVEIDAKDPSINIAGIGQGGLNLPDPGMYTDPTLLSTYTSHITTMFQLAGESQSDATQHAQQVVSLEAAIAAITVPNDQLFDPFLTYNKLNVSGLEAIAPQLPWSQFLSGMGYPDLEQLNVEWPPYFGNLSVLVSGMSTTQWVPYLRYSVINRYSVILPAAFANETFNFYGKYLYGQQEPPARWKFCISETDGAVGELLGAYFAEVSFGAVSKKVAQEMVLAIEAAMTGDLRTVSWMDETTRNLALDKMSKMANLVGYPDNPRNYSDLPVAANQFFTNYVNSEMNAFDRAMETVGQPSDRYQWEMTADTINAYYDPTRNEMVFPAGILQSPYFNVSWPLSMIFGGAGMIAGHENTHGFDSQGRNYDGTGRLVNWWTPESAAAFNERVSCVINQYSQYEVLPGVYINGNLTQGENVADMGGIKNAYNAYMKIAGGKASQPSIVTGLSNIQLFFVAYAQGWCQVATPQSLEVQVAVDPHSPARYRVIGPLQDLPEFSAAFNCPVGSYMNPPTRCEVW